MPLRWISLPAQPQLPLAREEPAYILAAPGSVTPLRRLSQALAASSLLAVGLRPMPNPLPRAAATNFTVTNLHPSGAGSLFQAVKDANLNPGPDTITFNPSLTGTIALTATLNISDAVQIVGPGPGQLSVSGSNALRVFYLYSPAQVPFTSTISGLTIRDGRTLSKFGGGGILDQNASLILDHVALISNSVGSKGGGGGLNFSVSSLMAASLTIRDSIISGNHAFSGGGIAVSYAPNGVVIQNSQIVSNSASYRGGGAFLLAPGANTVIEDSSFMYNTAGRAGGGLAIQNSYGGPLTIRRTTIFSNTSNFTAGGLYLDHLSDPLVIENTTISGNRALTVGGGVQVYDSSMVTIQNSTIVSNTANNAVGGIEVLHVALPITNTIIAGNLAPENQDISGTFQLKYDLVQVTGTATISNAGGNLFGLDPLLGPLADNGGPTRTHFPAHASPVVDAGDPAFAIPPATDQRGAPRVSGPRVDIGAVETQELFLPLIRR